MLTAETVQNMPVNGRDYTKLIYMNPGVAGSPDQISDSPGSFGEFSMNGARGRSNNYLLDGTDMNDGYRNDPAINQAGVFGTPSTILPIDAVAEVNVLSNFQPEYGRNAGAVVNIVTKSGTNQSTAALPITSATTLSMRATTSILSSQPKAPFHNNQYGGFAGWPDREGQDLLLRRLRRPAGTGRRRNCWRACPIRLRLLRPATPQIRCIAHCWPGTLGRAPKSWNLWRSAGRFGKQRLSERAK